MATQDIEGALAVVRRAIHDEIAGQRFYQDAAYHSVDPWAKEIFATLAQEEEDHSRLLLLEYEALTTQGRWIDLDTARTSDAEVDITRLTFSDDEPFPALFPAQWSVEGIVDRRTDDLGALAFGIKMERRAIDLYSQAASACAGPAAREAFEFLVQEEVRHYQELKTHWEKLAGRPFNEARHGEE
jgi:rubrerythrin